jgi:hypothetical protein
MIRIQVVQTINYYVKLARKIIFYKSLLKTDCRNTNQVAINTKTRGRSPLSTPEKLYISIFLTINE